MEPSTPIVLSMSDWARPGRELTTRSLLAFLYLCLGLVVLLLLFAVISEGGTGISWVSAVLAVMVAVLAAGLAKLARGAHRQLREIRAGRERGDVAVFPDHCRIHFPGVLAHDLVLAANQVRAICVDDRRPAWAALYWFRFPIATSGRGSNYAGCLFRPHVRNALQLLAPTAAFPNVAVLFDQPLRLEHATGLGQAAESFAVLAAQRDDVESAADLPGARPVDPSRAHPGIFLKVDSAAAARRAFASWPAAREVLHQSDVRHVRATPMPSTGRKLAGAVGFAWLAGAVVVTVSAIVSRSWSLVVPAVLVPTAVGGLLYETFHSLKALQRSRATAATVGTVCLMVAGVVVAVFEIREITTYDDPPPREPVPSYYVPDLSTPSAPPTQVP